MRLPTKWSEVRLKQYIQIVEVSAVDMDALDKNAKILSILSDEHESVVLKLPISQFKQAIAAIQFIYTKPEGSKLKQHYLIGKKRYKVNYKLSEITGGEYIDLTTFIKEPTKTTSHLPAILAIFFKPVNWLGFKKRNCYHKGIQTTDSRIESAKLLMDHLTMDQVAGLSGFFLRSYEAYKAAILTCIEKQNRKNQKKILNLYKKAGFLNTGAGA